MSFIKVQFNVSYQSRWGQQVYLCAASPGLDAVNHLLHYSGNGQWAAGLEIPVSDQPFAFSYYYIIKEAGAPDIFDDARDRTITIPAAGKDQPVYTVFDEWSGAENPAGVFDTQIFAGVLLKAPSKQARPLRKPARYTHCFRVKAPLLAAGETICITGSTEELGKWDTTQAVLMHLQDGYYTCCVKMDRETGWFQYKYGVFNKENRVFTAFETGDNRELDYLPGKKETVFLHDHQARLPLQNWRGAGVAIPVFSLRSKKSFGTGEFADLTLLADWAVKTGIKLLQLLPVNDTTAHKTNQDSYPYAANSAFALHPMFLRLDDIGTLPAGHKLQQQFERKQRKLNREPVVAYEEVMKYKLAYLEELFLQQKDAMLADEAFTRFFETNRYWLLPYAAFSYLRDKNKEPDFTKWKKHAEYDAAAIEKLCKPGTAHYNEIAFWYFVQYHLHVQLEKAVNYAHHKGVALKGDIPIGIDRHSCDAWMAPDLYNMDMQAGAPPDDFAVKGQNWGFPTYNWHRMQDDGFAWWKLRFEQMSRYFDAFRIDHILGFFRIWSIPMHAVEGIMGRFVPALPVHGSEFAQRNIHFNHDRYCRPYITDSYLWELFGSRADAVKATCLEPVGNGHYWLKPEFDTQRKIEAYINGLPEDAELKAYRQGLYDLVSNVLMFEDSEGNGCHFRIGMDKTHSFSQLDWHTQQQLKDVYINYFYRRQDEFWKQEALHKLPALKHTTNMLVCGEDLGMVPGCVADVMNGLSILGLEVQRMPKKTGVQFTHLAEVPWLSVVTPSTHDMSTIRGWWEEDRGVTQAFYNQALGHGGEAPEFCEAATVRDIIAQHLQSPAMWSIFQLQDLMGMDGELRREKPGEERINVPANPNHFWCYRMHIALEDLLKKKEFNTALKEMIEGSGR